MNIITTYFRLEYESNPKFFKALLIILSIYVSLWTLGFVTALLFDMGITFHIAPLNFVFGGSLTDSSPTEGGPGWFVMWLIACPFCGLCVLLSWALPLGVVILFCMISKSFVRNRISNFKQSLNEARDCRESIERYKAKKSPDML